MKSKIVTVSTPARPDRQEEVDLVGFWASEWGERGMEQPRIAS